MRLVNSRLLVRALLQSFLGLLFFWLGMMYDQSQKCSPLSQMSPEHVKNHPELAQAWESGLKHKETFLVVLVLTAPKNQERRNIIRQTWANVHRKLRDDFLLYFILGNLELSDETMEALNNEKAEYKDILALPLVDSYQGLTSKLMAGLVQLNRNVRFKYLLKVGQWYLTK